MEHTFHKYNCTIIYSYVQDNVIYIDQICTEKQHRNKGYGTKAMKEFLQEMGKNKVIYADVYTNKPLSFYKRLGFDINKRSDIWVVEIEI